MRDLWTFMCIWIKTVKVCTFFNRKSQSLSVVKRNRTGPNCLCLVFPQVLVKALLSVCLCKWPCTQWHLWDNCSNSHTRAAGITLRGGIPSILASFRAGCHVECLTALFFYDYIKIHFFPYIFILKTLMCKEIIRLFSAKVLHYCYVEV